MTNAGINLFKEIIMNVKHDGYSKRFGMDTRHGLPNVLFQVNIDGVTYQSIGGTIVTGKQIGRAHV